MNTYGQPLHAETTIRRKYVIQILNSKQRLLLESTGYGLLTLPKYWSEGKRFGGRCDWLEIPENIPEVDIHSRIDIDLIEALTKINPKLLP